MPEKNAIVPHFSNRVKRLARLLQQNPKSCAGSGAHPAPGSRPQTGLSAWKIKVLRTGPGPAWRNAPAAGPIAYNGTVFQPSMDIPLFSDTHA